jgi:hypothetical protein
MKKTSFVRKGVSSPSAQTPTGATSQSAAAAALPDGTRISTNTSQLLVSSGLDDLDNILSATVSNFVLCFASVTSTLGEFFCTPTHQRLSALFRYIFYGNAFADFLPATFFLP